MANTIITQIISNDNLVSIDSAESIAAEQLPPLVEVDGQQIHAPVLTEDGVLIVDTGRSILELELNEIEVLRSVILSLDVALAG